MLIFLFVADILCLFGILWNVFKKTKTSIDEVTQVLYISIFIFGELCFSSITLKLLGFLN